MARSEERHWWYRGLHDYVERQIRLRFAHWRPAHLKLLDAGCGTGKMAERLQNLGYQTVATDLSPTAVGYTRTRGVRDVFPAPLHQLPFRGDSIDGALCLDVIYLMEPALALASLREVLRVLRPGGYLFLQWATYERLRSAHDAAVGTVRRYGRDEGAALLREAGFEIVHLTHRYFTAFPLMAPMKWLRRNRSGNDHGLPPAWINEAAFRLLRWENAFAANRRLPAGTSVFAVARKPRV